MIRGYYPKWRIIVWLEFKFMTTTTPWSLFLRLGIEKGPIYYSARLHWQCQKKEKGPMYYSARLQQQCQKKKRFQCISLQDSSNNVKKKKWVLCISLQDSSDNVKNKNGINISLQWQRQMGFLLGKFLTQFKLCGRWWNTESVKKETIFMACQINKRRNKKHKTKGSFLNCLILT